MNTNPNSLNATKTHRNAVALMVGCALLMSISGIVTRQLTSATGFELTFWRSLVAGCFVLIWLIAVHGRRWYRSVLDLGRVGLLSGFFWSVMFTCFMLALTLTTVAKTMVVLAVAPLLTALLSWLILDLRIAWRTWLAIFVAGIGIVWMVSDALGGDAAYPHSLWGMLVAAGVPLASACNLVLMKKTQARIDLQPAVLVGAIISTLVMLPLALPGQASGHDIAWLAFLGVFQLGLPCTLLVVAARHLSPQETALLVLLEVIFAPVWVWIGAGEEPASATLWGGALVLSALIGNELATMHQHARRNRASAQAIV